MGINKNTFFYKAAILAASNLALQMLGFLYRVLLSRMVGSEGMGVYTLVMQVYTIVISLCLSGLCIAVTNLTARFQAKQDMAAIRKLVGCAMACFFCLFLLAALPVVLFHHQIASEILGDTRTANALFMVLCCIFLTGFENILKAAFHGVQLIRHTACSEVGEQLLRILAVSLLLRKFANGDPGRSAFLILFGMTLSEVFSVVFLSVSYWKRFSSGRGWRTGTAVARPMLQLAFPSAVTAIVCNVFSSAATIVFPSRLMLCGFTRQQAVSTLGILSGMAGPLFLLPAAFVAAVCTLLMPAISGAAATRDHAALQRKIDKGIQVTGLIAFPCTGLLLPFVPLLCACIFGQTVNSPLTVLMGAHTIVVYYLIVINGILNGLCEQRQVLLYAALGECLQLLLIFWLAALPAWNVYGYVAGMLIGDGVRLLLSFRRIRKTTNRRGSFFSDCLLPLSVTVILWFAARYLFFYTFSFLGSAVLAVLCTLAICSGLYLLLLQLLGVRVFRYLKGVLRIA